MSGGTPENPPAYPAPTKPGHMGGHWVYDGDPGMKLRDYFAAKAMQAMISKSSGQDLTGGKKGVPVVAEFAYEYADAMLIARGK